MPKHPPLIVNAAMKPPEVAPPFGVADIDIHPDLVKDLEAGCWHGFEPDRLADCNPIESVLPVGYDSTLTDDVFKMLGWMRNFQSLNYKDAAARLNADWRYTHLILEVLGRGDFTEYGVSPRNSWLTEKGESLLALAERWYAMRPAANNPTP